MLTKDQIEGCYWAFALGDAMGMPIEFNHIDVIRQRYGENGIQQPKSWAIWTDDTEMNFAVTRALLSLGRPEEIMDKSDDEIGMAFAREFIQWFDNMGYAPGITCKSEVFKLRSRGPERWREVGKNDSKGCGSAMRSAPIGIWFSEVLKEELTEGKGMYHDLMVRVSRLQSEITHGHKAATAAAIASAHAVSLAVNGVMPIEMIMPVEMLCGNIHADFTEALNRMKEAQANLESGVMTSELEAIEYIGAGWEGDEAFAMALHAAIRAPDDLAKSLLIAVNHSGDSDSVGCIAGSILGALHGDTIIPKNWKQKLAESARLEEMITRVVKFLVY